MQTRKVEALIFDMDGTRVDSMPWHAKAWIEYGIRHGVETVSYTHLTLPTKA